VIAAVRSYNPPPGPFTLRQEQDETMMGTNSLRAVTAAEPHEDPVRPDSRSGLAAGDPVSEAFEQLGRAIQEEPLARERVLAARAHLEYALAAQREGRFEQLLAYWAPLFYIVMTGIAQIAFIEMYCRWHGAWFLFPNPLNLYDPENVAKLANMDFVAYVNGVPTTMSVAAEVLMWSSLGVWAQRLFGMSRRYRQRRPDLPHDIATYIGILARNTSIAATVIIILRLSDFSVFGVSLDRFDATVGTAFLLGFFGEDTYRLLCKLRDTLLGQTPQDRVAAAE
jgi:hypothetical protein